MRLGAFLGRQLAVGARVLLQQGWLNDWHPDGAAAVPGSPLPSAAGRKPALPGRRSSKGGGLGGDVSPLDGRLYGAEHFKLWAEHPTVCSWEGMGGACVAIDRQPRPWEPCPWESIMLTVFYRLCSLFLSFRFCSCSYF